MAIRLDAVGDFLTYTPPNYNAAYTIMGWFYLVANTLEYRAIFEIGLGTNAQNRDAIFLNGAPTPAWYMQGKAANVGTDQSTGSAVIDTWYHVTLSRLSTTSLKFYLAGVDTLTVTTNVAARAAADTLYIGKQDNTAYLLNGRLAHVKVWTAALSAAEILTEMRSVRPQRQANLWAWWPMIPG